MRADLFEAPEGKRCAMCGRTLPLSFFYASRRAADGLQSYCRSCQRRYRLMHPTKEYRYASRASDADMFGRALP